MANQLVSKSSLQLKVDNNVILNGNTSVPASAKGVVILSQLSSKNLNNEKITEVLNSEDLATLSLDLLTAEEFEHFDNRYNVELLAARQSKVIGWIMDNLPNLAGNIGVLGSGKGAAAALEVATSSKCLIRAIVCRSGRPDLVMDKLNLVHVPTLLVVGELDPEVEEYNHQASRKLKTEVCLISIKGASHLFSEPNKLNEFCAEMLEWFRHNLLEIQHEKTIAV